MMLLITALANIAVIAKRVNTVIVFFSGTLLVVDAPNILSFMLHDFVTLKLDNLNSLKHTNSIENIMEEILISEDTFIVDSDQFYNNYSYLSGHLFRRRARLCH